MKLSAKIKSAAFFNEAKKLNIDGIADYLHNGLEHAESEEEAADWVTKEFGFPKNKALHMIKAWWALPAMKSFHMDPEETAEWIKEQGGIKESMPEGKMFDDKQKYLEMLKRNLGQKAQEIIDAHRSFIDKSFEMDVSIPDLVKSLKKKESEPKHEGIDEGDKILKRLGRFKGVVSKLVNNKYGEKGDKNTGHIQYGFAKVKELKDSAFFAPKNNYSGTDFEDLKVGDKVTVEVAETERGLMATSIRKEGGSANSESVEEAISRKTQKTKDAEAVAFFKRRMREKSAQIKDLKDKLADAKKEDAKHGRSLASHDSKAYSASAALQQAERELDRYAEKLKDAEDKARKSANTKNEAKMQLSLIKAPSGKYVFAGSVPPELAYGKKGGTVMLSDAELAELRSSSNPALVKKKHGIETLSFDSVDAALSFAKHKANIKASDISVHESLKDLVKRAFGVTISEDSTADIKRIEDRIAMLKDDIRMNRKSLENPKTSDSTKSQNQRLIDQKNSEIEKLEKQLELKKKQH